MKQTRERKTKSVVHIPSPPWMRKNWWSLFISSQQKLQNPTLIISHKTWVESMTKRQEKEQGNFKISGSFRISDQGKNYSNTTSLLTFKHWTQSERKGERLCTLRMKTTPRATAYEHKTSAEVTNVSKLQTMPVAATNKCHVAACCYTAHCFKL